jgi:hypothetical protein
MLEDVHGDVIKLDLIRPGGRFEHQNVKRRVGDPTDRLSGQTVLRIVLELASLVVGDEEVGGGNIVHIAAPRYLPTGWLEHDYDLSLGADLDEDAVIVRAMK